MRALALLLVLTYICATNGASHSLKYCYTGVTAGTDPEFTALGYVDEEQFMYYDSNIRKMIPRTEWIKENVGDDDWNSESHRHLDEQLWFKARIGNLVPQTEGVHTLQRMYGCDWDDETGAKGGFDQYGYDGEDFINFNVKTWRYIASSQQALSTVQQWNNPAKLDYDKYYLTQECVNWLKKHNFSRSTLERTVVPKVSLLRKDSSSSVVTCHVTGFYPRGIDVTWQRNGDDLDVDVKLGKTLSNEDGTFQITSHLTVKPEDWKSQKYTCTVEHKSLKQDIVLPVTEENIKKNKYIKTRSFSPEGSSPLMDVIIGCVVGILLLIFAVISFFVWKKCSSGYGKTNKLQSDQASPSSSDAALLTGQSCGRPLPVAVQKEESSSTSYSHANRLSINKDRIKITIDGGECI